ncbi:MAG: tetratricopeptide repeat protein [Pseudomonadota bacterium]|nr:tetratricopeptide repeat protein [Pseudomonadota bacterium]
MIENGPGDKRPAREKNASCKDVDALEEAEIVARKLLRINPKNSKILSSLGLILMEKKAFGSALEVFHSALQIDPNNYDYQSKIVRAAIASAEDAVSQDRCDLARLALELVLELFPDHHEILCHLSFVHTEIEDYSESLLLAERAIGLAPYHPHPHDVKGLALTGLGRFEDAIESFNTSIEQDNSYLPAKINCGSCLLQIKRNEEAASLFKDVLRSKPNNHQALNNLGLAYGADAKFSLAEEEFRRALKVKPDYAEAHFNLSRVLLMQGNYREGWDENEWRWKCKQFPSTFREFPYTMWAGENIQGKTILVWSEQGIGDEIMFAHPIPDLISEGANIVLECGERLVSVFSRSFQNTLVVPRENPPHESIENQGINYQIPAASLCKFFRDSKKSFAKAHRPYLTACPHRIKKFHERYSELGPGPLVGICWRSGNVNVGEERSVPLSLWEKILTQDRCRFVSLQYGSIQKEIKHVKPFIKDRLYIDQTVNPFQNVEDWFAQIAVMDLVISVDNSTIQVSGSQGVTTWTLINYNPEWRFGRDGKHHDWHNSVSVYRQKSPGDWNLILKELGDDFSRWHQSYY